VNAFRAALSRELPPRVGIVAAELSRFARPRYLEIGVNTGVLFLHVRAQRKVGVDPAAGVPRWKWFLHPNTLMRGSFFSISSDRFFAGIDPRARFDVVFVDGDHGFEQSRRDVEHALAHLAKDGVVLAHDCSPPTPAAASPDSADSGGGPWCGEVWKTIAYLRATREDVVAEVLDTDFGIGVIRRGRGGGLDLDPAEIERMTYDDLDREREHLLGLRPAQTA
jgi:methyltransferase family protein